MIRSLTALIVLIFSFFTFFPALFLVIDSMVNGDRSVARKLFQILTEED
jgi:hypothetical protein